MGEGGNTCALSVKATSISNGSFARVAQGSLALSALAPLRRLSCSPRGARESTQRGFRRSGATRGGQNLGVGAALGTQDARRVLVRLGPRSLGLRAGSLGPRRLRVEIRLNFEWLGIGRCEEGAQGRVWWWQCFLARKRESESPGS